jgi:general secretion pathway protein A
VNAAAARRSNGEGIGQESRNVYTEFFGLNEKPFAITPDPRYLYMSARHTDALAHLLYGISESGGFIQLTGEVGTGKTTLIRSVLEQLPEKADIAVILSPQLTTLEFLETIVQELHCPPATERTVKAQIDVLNVALMRAHAEGRRVVLIVDEAQTLSPELLEQVRLLTNLETSKQKLLQIILIGQPELRELLDRPEMRQIAQRITGRYHLEPLRKDDTRAYVNHRLRVAGAQSDVFTGSAISALFKHSRGIPRLINVIADRALLAGYTQDRRNVDARLVGAAAAEVFGARRRTPWWPLLTGLAGVIAVVFGVGNLSNAPRIAETPRDMFMSAVPASSATPTTSLSVETADDPAAAPVPAAADPLAAPAPVTLQSLLADPAFNVSTDAAIGELLALWGASYDTARAEPCTQAHEQGLRCLFQRRGTLGELRRVNWPTILSLVTADGVEHPVVVASLGYDHAGIVANGNSYELPLAELSYYWFGDHLLLWRPGDAPARDLSPGAADAGVRWLRETLAKLDGHPEPLDASTTYDDALEQRVRAYQRSHQLTVDGIVGARTQVAMLADLDLPDTPSLVEGH